MHENEIATQIVDAAYQIHSTVGPGLVESVYELMLAHELESRSLVVARQAHIPLVYKGKTLGEAYWVDLIVMKKVLVELKSVEHDAPVHRKQVITYLKLSGLKLGLLINFGKPLIKHGISRLVNDL